jgi:hypothetical protein
MVHSQACEQHTIIDSWWAGALSGEAHWSPEASNTQKALWEAEFWGERWPARTIAGKPLLFQLACNVVTRYL